VSAKPIQTIFAPFSIIFFFVLLLFIYSHCVFVLYLVLVLCVQLSGERYILWLCVYALTEVVGAAAGGAAAAVAHTHSV
jgi:hypothetical protein